MFGMLIETVFWSKILYGIQKVINSEFLYKSFVVNVLQFQFFFCKAFNGFYSIVV